MQLYRIEKITLKPLLVFARSHEDAANILAHAFVTGMSHRPDADFDVETWEPEKTGAPEALRKWDDEGWRGLVWNIDERDGWEVVRTNMIDPEEQ